MLLRILAALAIAALVVFAFWNFFYGTNEGQCWMYWGKMDWQKPVVCRG